MVWVSHFFLFHLQLILVPGMALQGSLLVRNITYQKTVMVRYTMDEWETVNDASFWAGMMEIGKNEIGSNSTHC
jgi:hypothetical protein